MKFGLVSFPHNARVDYSPTLLEDDLDRAIHPDRLGFGEVWCGEHRSSSSAEIDSASDLAQSPTRDAGR